VLDNARKFRTHPLIDSAALQVLETKDRQGLLPCSPKSAPATATTH
jgi:hypothetical protein